MIVFGSERNCTIQTTYADGWKKTTRSPLPENQTTISRKYSLMKLAKLNFYGGAREKVCRLGLAHIFLELQEILTTTEVRIQNKKQANGAGRVRELIDERFAAYDDWVLSKSGDIDWVKRLRFNETIVSRMGVEIQVSGRSDLLARDIIHIRNNLQDSHIDVGVIVVPSDDFEYFLTDRVANYSYAVRYV